jgi:hypothetical protein
MVYSFSPEGAGRHNQFSHRNYPISVGFNKAEDKYAFGGSSDAVFTSN